MYAKTKYMLSSWIFYDYPGYTGDSYVVVLRSWLTCVPLRGFASRASSVKYVGDGKDYRVPSITLYKGSNFTGQEIYITDDHHKALFGGPSTDGPGGWMDNGGWSEEFGSFIITGDSSSCWTLYYAIGHHLSSRCVCGQDTSNYYPLMVPNDPLPPANRIGSVRKGCGGKVQVEHVQAEEMRQNYRNGLKIPG